MTLRQLLRDVVAAVLWLLIDLVGVVLFVVPIAWLISRALNLLLDSMDVYGS